MKLLLIQPPIRDFYETDIRLQPIGLCYLKAALKKHLPEIEVVIRDYHRGWGRKTIPIPKELRYLKEYYEHPDMSPFSVFHNYYHFGADLETILQDMHEIKPDFAGLSMLFSPYYREALEVAEAVKKSLGIPVIAGGSHVSAMPEAILKHPAIDFIIQGEGEKPLVEFLTKWLKGESFSNVSNLGYKQNGRLFLNPIASNYPIDDLPIPDLTDFNLSSYAFERKPMTFMITSRSCPHRCTFCSVHKTFGFEFRRRNINRVFDEIVSRYEAGFRVIDFEDDNLTFYKEEMKQLCRMIIHRFPNQEINFTAMNGISYLSLDHELLELMRQAGFTHLNLALVSSDITVRETTKRPHTMDKYLEVVNSAFKLGFRIVSYQILGLPNETLDSMIQTLLCQTRLPVLMGASMFYLTPNSPIAAGFPKPDDSDVFMSRLTAMAIETSHFTREDIYTLFITTRILNFLKSIDKEGISDLTAALLYLRNKDKRSGIGVEQLLHFFRGEPLCAFATTGWKPIKKFKASLFWKIWNQVEFVMTTRGNKISLPHQKSLEKQERREPPITEEDFLLPLQRWGK